MVFHNIHGLFDNTYICIAYKLDQIINNFASILHHVYRLCTILTIVNSSILNKKKKSGRTTKKNTQLCALASLLTRTPPIQILTENACFLKSLLSQEFSFSRLILMECHRKTREFKLSIGTKVSQKNCPEKKSQNCLLHQLSKSPGLEIGPHVNLSNSITFLSISTAPRKAVVSDTFQSLLHPCFVLSGI